MPSPVDRLDPDAIGSAISGGVRPHDHFVELYETDQGLVESVGRFVRLGIEAGEACIVVAESQHLDAIEKGLRQDGVDPWIAETRGLYQPFDAHEMMGMFVEDGVPNPERFERAVGGAIERAGEGERKIRIFGEMVAVMWKDGNVAGALQLEDFWNELSTRHEFKLYCAYPSDCFGDDNLAPLRAVCHRHSHVIVEPARS